MLRYPTAGLTLTLTLAVTASAPLQARAQTAETQYQAPAHIALIDGAAYVEQGSRVEPAETGTPLLAGDRVRTDRGRVEILFADGSALDLDNFTVVDMPSDAMLRVLAGRIRLTIEGDSPDEPVAYRIDTPGGSVEIRTVGEYRVSLTGTGGTDQVELAVIRGAADLTTGLGTVPVTAGQRAVARADAPPSYPYAFNSAAWDAFDRWSEDQRRARLGVVSTAYLPDELYAYGGTFDRYGEWRRHATHGYVWYPTVAVDWRPYYLGRWGVFPSLGWTWIGYDPWAWPTHHYGRWGISAGLWFWIPGRHWGPAWVSWASAPGYVAWCPLGYNARPIVSVNVFFGSHRYRSAYGHHGWTVLPARYLGHANRRVSTYAVDVAAIDGRTRATFVERRAVPTPGGLAVPRTTPVLRSAGRRTAGVTGGDPSSRARVAVARDRGSAPSAPSAQARPRLGSGTPTERPTVPARARATSRAQSIPGVATRSPARASALPTRSPTTSTTDARRADAAARRARVPESSPRAPAARAEPPRLGTRPSRSTSRTSPDRTIRIVGSPRPRSRPSETSVTPAPAGRTPSRPRPDRTTAPTPAPRTTSRAADRTPTGIGLGRPRPSAGPGAAPPPVSGRVSSPRRAPESGPSAAAGRPPSAGRSPARTPGAQQRAVPGGPRVSPTRPRAGAAAPASRGAAPGARAPARAQPKSRPSGSGAVRRPPRGDIGRR